MATQTLLTLADYSSLPDDGKYYELDEGELIEMTVPNLGHRLVQQRLNFRLAQFLEAKELGLVMQEPGCVLGAEPPIVRIPDVAFIRQERIAAADPKGNFIGAPDIAIEVISPSNPAGALRKKIREYFAAGAQQVWVIYPEERAVEVWESADRARVVSGGDSLEAPDLLPRFRVAVDDLLDG